MVAFRYLVALISFAAFFLVTSTNCASLSSPMEVRTPPKKEIETEGQVEVTISIPEFIKEFEKLNEHQQRTVLDFFKEHTKPFGFSWEECFPYFSSNFRLPGCPPPPLKGCPVPPHGCRPPPPQWYCPKPPKKSKHPHQKVCPKPPPKPPICKPWQKGFYHLKPEDEHI